MQSDIGLIGLAVMGQNLVLNMVDHGFNVAVYNRTYSKTQDFLSANPKGTSKSVKGTEGDLSGHQDIKDFIASLKRPRKVMLMVQAGTAVDAVIAELLPLLEKGDIIIDGGNSDYHDSNRRYKDLKEKGILFIGSGVSGGEEGARLGPSLMPGGNKDAWESVKPIFEAISAKTPAGEPCCQWMGEGGSGHFVKMVHNGIEYGDMQLIAEVYHIMKDGLGLSNDEMSAIFTEWNKTELDSYLIEITANVLKYKENGISLVDKILDKAGQKGTGKWTAQGALEQGIPLTLITESVFARALSSMKDERVKASQKLNISQDKLEGDKKVWVEKLRKALLASKVISYAQGFMMLKEASETNKWNLNFGGIALTWREGCIIRSRFLQPIKEAFDKNPNLENLMLDDYFADILKKCLPDWRKVVSSAVGAGIPAPCLTAGISFFEGYRSATLPANLIQAQRDYFGAHTYERTDRQRGEFFHTEWITNSK